jgi:hypothetical protein
MKAMLACWLAAAAFVGVGGDGAPAVSQSGRLERASAIPESARSAEGDAMARQMTKPAEEMQNRNKRGGPFQAANLSSVTASADSVTVQSAELALVRKCTKPVEGSISRIEILASARVRSTAGSFLF